MQSKPRRNAENNFATFLKFIADPALIIDGNAKILVVNDALVCLTGLKKKDLVGTQVLDLSALNTKNKAIIAKNFEKRVKGLTVKPYEITFTDRNGEVRSVEVTSKKIDYFKQLAFLVVIHDITQREAKTKQLEQYSEKMEALVNEKVKEIEKSEKNYRELINRMNDTVWVIDFDSKFIDVNDAAVRLLGYSREELLSMGPQDIDDSLDAEQIKRFVEQAPTQQMQILETEHTTKDGRKIPVEISSSLVTYQGKHAFLSIARDISERKKAAAKLSESEDKYRTLVEQSLQGIIIVQFNPSKVVFANNPAAKILGYTVDELKSLSQEEIKGLLHPTDMPVIVESFKEALIENGAPVRFDYRMMKKDGNVLWVEVFCAPTTYAGKPAAHVFLVDITERKQAEQAILRSKTEWERTFDSVPDLIAIIDDQHRIVRVNQAMAQRLGVTPEQCTGLKCYEAVHETDAPPEFCPHAKTLRDGQEHIAEVHEDRLGGDFLVSTTPLSDERGKMIGSVHVARDITELKKSEEALKESEEKFRNLSEESPNMIFINKQGRVVYANKKCEDLMGYTKEEFYAPTFNFFSLIAPESLKKLNSVYNRQRAGEEVAPHEYDLVTKAGKRISVVITTKLIKYDGERAILGIITDITERKQLENALRENEEMFRAISTSAMDAIILLDDKAKITYWNPAAEKIFGYTQEEALGKKLDNLVIPPQYHGIHSKTTISSYQKGQNHKKTIEAKALRKNGTEFPLELSITTVEIKDKKHVLGIVRDITERQKMEMTLREAEKRYHALFDKAPLGILVIDETGTAVEFNEEAHRQLGYTREEFAKLTVSDYVAFETPEEIRARMKKVLRDGKDEFETKHRTKNGEIRDVINTVQVIELAGKKFFHMITQDITEKKKIENELKLERDKLEAATENIGAGLGIISKDYRILWVNRYLKQVNPGCEGKKCFSTFNSLKSICPDCGVRKVFDEGVALDRHEYAFIGINGNPMWAELIVTPLKDKDGNIIAALELSVDITEKKLLQKKLKEYSEKLEQLVEERTDQLQQTQAKLVKSERLAAIGELAAMVGHDLRNPLTGIMGAAYYLKTKHTGELGAKGQEMLETIEKAITYSNKIVNDLLEYSRDPKLEFTEATPKELLENALSLTEVPETIKVVDSTEDKPAFKADAEKMQRVFVNIIRNAFDAMPEGGTLTVKSRKVEGKLEISFKDTGAGMSKETLRKLKGGVPLFTTKAKGMGFGVPICKRIVEAHGGKLSVESNVGKGTKITITVPVKPKPTNESEPKLFFNDSILQMITTRQKAK